jgi:hypothetical protein
MTHHPLSRPLKPKPGRAACVALAAVSLAGGALAFTVNPGSDGSNRGYAPTGQSTGLDLQIANLTRSHIRLDPNYPMWPVVYAFEKAETGYTEELKWNGTKVWACGGNEFRMEGPSGFVPPQPVPYWSLPDSSYGFVSYRNGKQVVIYYPTRPGICSTNTTQAFPPGPIPVGRLWWETVNEAFAYRIGRPVRAFRQGSYHLIHGGPLPTPAHVCAVPYEGTVYVGSFFNSVCSVQVREPRGEMRQQAFGHGPQRGLDKVTILMDSDLTSTQWSTNKELQDQLAVTLLPLPGQRLPRRICQARLPMQYKGNTPIAVGWTDDEGRCHVPQEVKPDQYDNPAAAVVLKPGSYSVLITFKYVLADWYARAGEYTKLYPIWQKVLVEQQF